MATNSSHATAKRHQACVKLIIAMAAVVAWFVVAASSARGQDDSFGFAGDGSVFPDVSLNGFGNTANEPAQWFASYSIIEGTEQGVLELEATLGNQWHIYSTTQKPGGPKPTQFSLETKDATVTAAFQPDRKPATSISDVWKGLPLEEFEGSVVWRAPITVSPGYRGPIKVAADGMTCRTGAGCMQFSELLTAKFAGTVAATATQLVAEQNATAKPKEIEPAKGKPFREPRYVVEWTASTSGAIAPGAQGHIKFTATPDPTFHVYIAAVSDEKFSTNFGVSKKNGLKIGKPVTSAKVVKDKVLPVKYHKGQVTWVMPVEVPVDAKPGKFQVEGFIGYQACTDKACRMPVALKFTSEIIVGEGKAIPVKLEKANRGEALDAANGKWPDDVELKAEPAADHVNASARQPVVAPKPTFKELLAEGGTALGSPLVQTDRSRSVMPPAAATVLPPSPPSIAASEPPADTHEPATEPDSDEAEESEVASFVVAADSPQAIAEMAKLYDPSEKVKYLTLEDMANHPVGSGGSSLGNATTFWSALFGAFVGGMLLNLMPCVFPVLGLKVMGFVKQAGNDPAKIRKHGFAFAAGLIVAMWILAGVILAFKYSLGQDINWGAQMGNPYFVCAMIVLLYLLGLNMAGVFEFGTSMTRVGGTIQGKEGYTSSFLSGVLTTLIATPCSGPFLGAAMSYTLAQTAGVAMVLFTVFALGIAAPYVALCFFPALINKLPRPGAWMETFKVTMAFALFATVAFFMKTFGGQTGAAGLSWLVMALVVIGLAAYYYGNWSAPHIATQKRWLAGYALPLVIAGVGGWMCYSAASQRDASASSSFHAGGLAWQKWNPGKVEYSLVRNKRPIWVDYTAEW